MDFRQFTSIFMGQVFSMPYSWAGLLSFVAALVVELIEWKFPNVPWVAKMRHWPTIVFLALFIILTPFSVIFVSYQMYQEQQTQINKINEELRITKETFRPVLTVDTDIVSSSVKVNDSKKIVQFSLDHYINNTGNRPAYQTQIECFTAPLNDPSKITMFPNWTQMNAIPVGNHYILRQNLTVYYSTQGDNGRVIIYLLMKYSDSAEGKTLYQEPYWWSFLIDTNNQVTAIEVVNPVWTIPFKSYADNLSLPK